ncbi:hypothetical protein MTR62_12620 [Novosphingobium sp. 1949]|uniref:Uncharacterized protein n=1 Tax=Novosphingobium organovorum TaxID=2930092 RepID=A0ABT0BFA2_9SPHN|nr:hypothetical protein [Novosphingobium organovorum]MCJ2183528.1 hypothetical protein [Novosphingobium organovorum]
MRRPVRSALALAPFFAALMVPPASAQAPASPATPAPAPAPTKGDPVAARVRLNTEQGEFARRQLAETAASQKAHDDAQARIAQDQSMYGALRQEYPELEQRYAAAKVDWQKAVEACAQRDLTHCPTANQAGAGASGAKPKKN